MIPNESMGLSYKHCQNGFSFMSENNCFVYVCYFLQLELFNLHWIAVDCGGYVFKELVSVRRKKDSLSNVNSGLGETCFGAL